MKTETELLHALPKELRRNWGHLLALGILFVLMGTIGLGMMVSLTMVSVLILGILLLIAGGVQIIDVFKSKQWKAAVWHGLIATLYLIGGGVIIHDPLLASTVITVFIAWGLIIIGIIRLIIASTLRQVSGWVWFVFAGVIAISLGILILMQWPSSGLWVLGMFIAIELIVTGWTYIFIAVAIKKA